MLITFSGRRASQNEFELLSFIDLLKSRGVTRYCEIGARHGDTFHAVMSALPDGSHGVAVDLPGALWGIDSSRGHLTRAANDLRAMHYTVDVIFGDSQTREIADLVREFGPYDAILIDGDHSLPGVTLDWHLYGDMSSLTAFHDIVGTGQAEKVHGSPVEVPLLWASIVKGGAETVEFVGEGSKMGIGCVLK